MHVEQLGTFTIMMDGDRVDEGTGRPRGAIGDDSQDERPVRVNGRPWRTSQDSRPPLTVGHLPQVLARGKWFEPGGSAGA